MYYNSLNNFLREKFHTKVYKLALSSGCTCPNRDGTLSKDGCIFCSNGGSGDFATSATLSINAQIDIAKEKVAKKIKDGKYIAYFQSFTNTYGDILKLRKIFFEAINHPDIVALSIGTRPDCLPPEIIALLDELNHIKPVWVELGLQTIHERSAKYINRQYALPVFNKAVYELNKINVDIIVHLIIGLPYETEEMIYESIKYVSSLPIAGIKLQLLHVLKNTPLEKEYLLNKFDILSMDDYVRIISKSLQILPKNIVIHRLSGDGPKSILVAPLWSGDKKRFLNYMNKYFRDNNIIQGSLID